jgi:hypothetical protein
MSGLFSTFRLDEMTLYLPRVLDGDLPITSGSHGQT